MIIDLRVRTAFCQLEIDEPLEYPHGGGTGEDEPKDRPVFIFFLTQIVGYVFNRISL